MIFTETALPGAFVIELERREDSRGYFARAFCQHEFADHGLKPSDRPGERRLQQDGWHACAECISSSRRRPRRRSCVAYAARSSTSSSTSARRARRYLESVSVELNEENGRALYVPERFAHGYQTLVGPDGNQLSGW